MSAEKVSPQVKRNIYRILPFGFLWGAFAILYILLEKGLLGPLDYYPSTGNSYSFHNALLFTTGGSVITGLILGTIEILYLNRFFRDSPLASRLLLKPFFTCCSF